MKYTKWNAVTLWIERLFLISAGLTVAGFLVWGIIQLNRLAFGM